MVDDYRKFGREAYILIFYLELCVSIHTVFFNKHSKLKGDICQHDQNQDHDNLHYLDGRLPFLFLKLIHLIMN